MSSKYVVTNLAESATITASSTTSGFSTDNLVDGALWTSWQSSSGTSHNIRFRFSSAQDIDIVGIMGHTIPSGVTNFKIQKNTGTQGSPTWEDVADITHRERDVYVEFTSINSIEIRLLVTGSTFAPAIGQMVIGAAVELPRTFRWGVNESRVSYTDKHVTVGGVVRSYKYADPTNVISGNFQLTTQSDIDAFETLWDAVENFTPFMFVPFAGSTDTTQAAKVYYGRFDDGAFSMVRAGPQDASLSLTFNEDQRDIVG